MTLKNVGELTKDLPDNIRSEIQDGIRDILVFCVACGAVVTFGFTVVFLKLLQVI